MLPLEIIIGVAHQLNTDRDFLKLARTCKTIHRMLIERPWKSIHIHFRPCWKGNSSGPVTRCRGVRDGTVHITSVWQKGWNGHRQCSISPRETCEIDAALHSVNAYLNRRARNTSTGLQELTLSGWLPQILVSPQSLLSINGDTFCHTLGGARGLGALRPEILNIELNWASWSPIMLSGFDLTRLRSLKIPVRAPWDCIKTAAAFTDMTHLASLAITELSDSPDFVDEFHHLGAGIMALSSSLRSLDISITNSNRVEGWENNDAFVEPDDTAFFFQKLFPEPSCERVEALIRTRYDDPREPVYVNRLRSPKGPLNLECIHLKHIGLPWWAFQTVFNPGNIKEFDLLTCRMAPNVWDELAKHAQLHKLANVSYALLSDPSFTDFLSTQHSLHFLSFVRPPDVYKVISTRSRLADDFGLDITTFAVAETAPHLGPGTEWGRSHLRDAWLLQSRKSWIQYEHLIQSPGSWSYFENLIRSLGSYDQWQYPKKSDFVKVLSNNASLKHLVLPVDVFDITPMFMACLAIELPALESVEWGFNYACPKLRTCFMNEFLPNHPRLKKITFLSLNRPHALSDFDAKYIRSTFVSGSDDLAPATLKYIRCRDLNDRSHEGKFTTTEVYYHRGSIANGTWWLEIPARQAESMFEDGRIPDI